MKRLKIYLAFLSVSLSASENYLLPNAQITFTPKPAGECGALAFLGEVGSRNFRANGTYGHYFTPSQRIKFSAEILTQRIDYEFLSGNMQKWVSQYAFGTSYQYLMRKSLFQTVDVGGSYSHAFDRHISSMKRIAGSNGGFTYLGSTLRLWNSGYMAPKVHYDYVNYYQGGFKRVASGVGGSLSMVQQLPKNFSLNLGAELRKPFYFYESTLNWDHLFNKAALSIGVYANYSNGKKGLPDTVTGGIKIGLAYGGKPCCFSENFSALDPLPGKIKEHFNASFQDPEKTWMKENANRMFCDPTQWVSTPAVYIPLVLAISSEMRLDFAKANRVSPFTPTSSPLSDSNFISGDVVYLPLGNFFHSDKPFTFSAVGLPSGLNIDPNTGTLAGTATPAGTYQVTITATSEEGSTSQSFRIFI